MLTFIFKKETHNKPQQIGNVVKAGLLKHFFALIVLFTCVLIAEADNLSTALYNALKKYDSVGTISDNGASVEKDNKWGFVNAQGQEIVPCIYEKIENFKNDVARVKRNNKWGLVNSQGQEIIPCKYDGIRFYDIGIAITKQKDKYGLVNSAG